MTYRAGLGLYSGQVPVDSGKSVTREYEDMIYLAQLAEELEYDSYWVTEHHFADDSYLPSTTGMLGALAVATSRITLGTGVNLAPFHHPLRFAEDNAVIDQIAHGRLLLVVAAGWRDEEFRQFGVPMSERVGRVVDLVEVCHAAWKNEKFSYHGKYYDFEDVELTPKPFGELPLWMGGTAPKALARAGRLADGYFGTPRTSLKVLQDHVAAFDEGAEAAGRDAKSLPIGFHMNAWVSKDGKIPDGVLKAMWHQIGTYRMWHKEETEREPLDMDELLSRTFYGTPQQVIDKAGPWVEAFTDRELQTVFRLQYPGMDRGVAEEAMQLFAAEVNPVLRKL